MLEKRLLDPQLHDRHSFRSGAQALDDYLHRYAAQQSKKGVSVVRVLIDSKAPSKILGYYSLSAAQVDSTQLNDAAQKALPRYPVPCFRMGRLATHIDQRGQGLGRVLMGCAVNRCQEARKQVAAYALLVDAKDEQAKAFYLHYGFIALRDHPMALYLPLGT